VKLKALLAAVVLAAAADAGAQAESWLYRVQFEAATPFVARVEVELPPLRRAREFDVRVRGATMSIASQVFNVSCDGTPLTADASGTWRIDGRSCARLAWQVQFNEVTEAGVDAAQQASVYEPRLRLWLLSDPASLLRPVDAGAAHQGEIEFIGGGVVNGGAYGSRAGRRRLPSAAFAPEFFAIGNAPVSIVREGQADLIYVNALGVPLTDLFGQHRRALGYLMKVTGARFDGLLRSTVVWLPIAAGRNETGGAAGFRTLLVNGAVESGRLVRAEATLAVLLHEQFHQLTQVGLPLWANESLAQYYALKALRRSDLPRDAVLEVERRFIDPMRSPRLTLRQVQARVQQQKDKGEYSLFYSDGATFWDRVDRAIQRRSAGFRTLDSLLPAILGAKWENDQIPRNIVEMIQRHAGDDAADRLIERYVGI
jgi:hypothetical protein